MPSTSISAKGAAPVGPSSWGSGGTARSQPMLAAMTYLAFSTTLTLANKCIFSDESFNYPWSTLAMQSFFVVFCLSSYQISQHAITFSPALARMLVMPCVLFTLYLFSNSRALRYLSLPILSVLKSLAPMGIAIGERVLFGDPISLPVSLAMLLIVMSNTITLWNAPASSSEGYLWALLNVCVNIAYVLSLRMCLSAKFSPVEKTLHSNMLACILMLPIAVANNEVQPFFQHLRSASWLFSTVFASSCLLAAAIGASIFWLVEQTSGSTLSFAGACNKFPVVILGALLFHTEISAAGWMSVLFGVMAGVIFAVAKAREKADVVPVSQAVAFRNKYSGWLVDEEESANAAKMGGVLGGENAELDRDGAGATVDSERKMLA